MTNENDDVWLINGSVLKSFSLVCLNSTEHTVLVWERITKYLEGEAQMIREDSYWIIDCEKKICEHVRSWHLMKNNYLFFHRFETWEDLFAVERKHLNGDSLVGIFYMKLHRLVQCTFLWLFCSVGDECWYMTCLKFYRRRKLR